MLIDTASACLWIANATRMKESNRTPGPFQVETLELAWLGSVETERAVEFVVNVAFSLPSRDASSFRFAISPKFLESQWNSSSRPRTRLAETSLREDIRMIRDPNEGNHICLNNPER